MTDWLDDILDTDSGSSAPEGFAERVTARVQAEPEARLLRFPRMFTAAAAGIALLAVGFWIGRGAPELHSSKTVPSGPDVAELNLDEIYADRELLENLDLLADEDLELVFRDGVAGTWMLDEEMPADPSESAPANSEDQE